MSLLLDLVGKPVLSHFLQTLVEKFLPNKLVVALEEAVSKWVQRLPAEYTSTEPHSVLKGLRPGKHPNESDEELACWDAVHGKLFGSSIPSEDDWYQALTQRWRLARQIYGEGAEALFRADNSLVDPLLHDLASKLEEACALQDDLFKPEVYRKVTATVEGIDALTQQVANLNALASVPQTGGETADVEIELAESRLNENDFLAARALLQKIKSSRWDRLTIRQRCRLLSLMANTFIREENLLEAGKLLLEAKSLQPDDERTLVNETLAFEILGEPAKAHALADSLKGRFPHSTHLWSVWVRTAPENIALKIVVDTVPSFVQQDQQVCIALSVCATRRSDYESAVDYSAKAKDQPPVWPPAWLVWAQALHAHGWHAQKSAERASLFRKAENAYAETINHAHDQNYRQIEAIAHFNRGIIREVLNEPEAQDDFERAATLDQKNPLIVRSRAIRLIEAKNYDEAVSVTRAIHASAPTAETGLFLAFCLFTRRADADILEALELCSDVALVQPAGEDTADAVELLISILLHQKQTDRAAEVLKQAEARISPLAYAIIQTLLLFKTDRKPEAKSAAEAAADTLTDATPLEERRRLAWRLALVGSYAKATQVFLTFVKHGILQPDVQALLESARLAREDKVLLDALEALREAGIRDSRLLFNEVGIRKVYDPDGTVDLVHQRISESPGDKQARLLLSLLGLELHRPELLCKDPALLPNIDEVAVDAHARVVVATLLETGNLETAVQFGYGLLRRKMGSIEAHRAYLLLFHHRSIRRGRLPLLATPKTVSDGCAVCFKEGSGEQPRWIIIEDSELVRPELNEFPPAHPLSCSLKGKRVGDEVQLAEGSVQNRTGTIQEIRNKYVFRYQECINRFQFNFPDEGDVQLINVARTGEDGVERIDFSAIENSLKQVSEQIVRVLDFYRSYPVSLHLVSSRIGRSLFDLLESLIAAPDRGIICCAGTLQEREEALSDLQFPREIVLDATACFTLIALNRVELLEHWPVAPILSVGTRQLLRDWVARLSDDPPQRWLALDQQGKLARLELDPKETANYAEKLRENVRTIETRCRVLTCEKLLDIVPEERLGLVEWFGQDGAESIVLATENGRVLWTDDYVMGLWASQKHNVDRIWTQVALQAAVDNKVLDIRAFQRYSAVLFAAGYSFTWWNEEILLDVAGFSDWDADRQPLKALIRWFGSASADFPGRFRGALSGIIRFYQGPAPAVAKNRFIVCVMDQLSRDENPEFIGRLLKYAIARACPDNPKLVREVRTVVQIWSDWRLAQGLGAARLPTLDSTAEQDAWWMRKASAAE